MSSASRPLTHRHGTHAALSASSTPSSAVGSQPLAINSATAILPKHKPKSLLDLPLEIKTIIFTYFTHSDLLNLAVVSSAIRDLAEARIWRYFNLEVQFRPPSSTRPPPKPAKFDDPLQIVSRALAEYFDEDNSDDDKGDDAKLWCALRFLDLQRAMTLRPARLLYVRDIRYNAWLADIEGWSGILAKIWPCLESASIRIGQYTGTRLTSHEAIPIHEALQTAYLELPLALGLRNLTLLVKGPINELIEHVIRLAPNVRSLTMRCDTSVISLPRLAVTTYTLSNLTHFKFTGAEYSQYSWLTHVIRHSENLVCLEVIGDPDSDRPPPPAKEDDHNYEGAWHPHIPIRPIARAIRDAPHLHTLVWLSLATTMAELVEVWDYDGQGVPNVQECALIYDRKADYHRPLLAVSRTATYKTRS
jgi:hypothetical protein